MQAKIYLQDSQEDLKISINLTNPINPKIYKSCGRFLLVADPLVKRL